MDEHTIAMPVKQYTECIMALQKLDDIRRLVMYSPRTEEAVYIVKAIMRITEPIKEGEVKEGDSDG
jgi:hypothetical protein